jgi:hypothetical protein
MQDSPKANVGTSLRCPASSLRSRAFASIITASGSPEDSKNLYSLGTAACTWLSCKQVKAGDQCQRIGQCSQCESKKLGLLNPMSHLTDSYLKQLMVVFCNLTSFVQSCADISSTGRAPLHWATDMGTGIVIIITRIGK